MAYLPNIPPGLSKEEEEKLINFLIRGNRLMAKLMLVAFGLFIVLVVIILIAKYA